MQRHPRIHPSLLAMLPLLFCLAPALVHAQPSPDQRRRAIRETGQMEFWGLRDPREALTLDRVTDPRAAWARIELLVQQPRAASLDDAESLLRDTLAKLKTEARARAAALRSG